MILQTYNTAEETLLSYKNFSDGTDAPNDQFDNSNGTCTSS